MGSKFNVLRISIFFYCVPNRRIATTPFHPFHTKLWTPTGGGGDYQLLLMERYVLPQGRRKKTPNSLGYVRNFLTPRFFADSEKKIRCFIIFRNAYQQIQNGLKRMILREKIQNNLKSFQIHIFTFQNILHQFLI